MMAVVIHIHPVNKLRQGQVNTSLELIIRYVEVEIVSIRR
jgi:hypothetical protein